MAYSELVKNFNRIRDYMREFYVYGFKSRSEYTKKSARSYDDERRRIESWLGDYMQFRQSPEGKNVFLSLDSRVCHHNPLYKAWKAKSFTDGDITLHFLLLDMLAVAKEPLSLNEMNEKLCDYLESFEEPRLFDESTIRKQLKEYVAQGIVETEKRGRAFVYKRAAMIPCYDQSLLHFFSEVSPCGVIGSFLLDKEEPKEDYFTFKHHYITGTLDSEIHYQIFLALEEQSYVDLSLVNHKGEVILEKGIVPLSLFISVQSGRQYLMGYSPRFRHFIAFRTDHILSVTKGEKAKNYISLREKLEVKKAHMWGVSSRNRHKRTLETVEFTVVYKEDEPHIHQRLEREKRCGQVEQIDEFHSRFFAEVYDTAELIPWIRTFICRIDEIHFSNAALEEMFKSDLKAMYELYDLEGGEAHDI